MGGQLLGGQGVDQPASGRVERSLLREHIGHRLAAGVGPNCDGGDELISCNQTAL